ncbi:MAG: hypothetical protein KDD94_04370, partial [Calditrichaeota bacterium]|nr:hypothetical protein [Calditrichota bacterium]
MGPEDLIRLGRYWAAKLKYYPNSDVPRDFANQIAQEINDELDDGVSIRPGWRAYDPVISMNGRKPSSYEQLSDFFSQQEDGGAESANRILGWMNNELQFEDLLPQEQDFAAITHLAETGRGYNPPSTNLENFLTEITESESGEDAANVWLD